MPLTQTEIDALLAIQSNRGRSPKDTTEPRTTENWWKQDLKTVYRPDNPELNCSNVNCIDPRPDETVRSLALIKDRLMCRYCFLDGWLSGIEHS